MNTDTNNVLDYGMPEPLIIADMAKESPAGTFAIPVGRRGELAFEVLQVIARDLEPSQLIELAMQELCGTAKLSRELVSDVLLRLVVAYPTTFREVAITDAVERGEGHVLMHDVLDEDGDQCMALFASGFDTDDWCDAHPRYDLGDDLKRTARDMSLDEWCDLHPAHPAYDPGLDAEDVEEVSDLLEEAAALVARAQRKLNNS